MATSNRNSKSDSNRAQSRPAAQSRPVYSEFGNYENQVARQRAVPDRPPSQQNLRVQASRKGRKGKTVTVISGFQAQPETLATLLKQLKTQCGAGGTMKDNELEIQGNHTQTIVQTLNQLGYKAKVSGG